jgi:hypothetical protein
MNDTLLALKLAAVLALNESLVALFSTDEPEPVPHIFGQQSGEITARPSLTIFGEYEPYPRFRKGDLHCEIKSRMADAPQHDARVIGLLEVLFGEEDPDDAVATAASLAAAKSALKAALAADGVRLVDYGFAPEGIQADAEGDDLRTIINLRVAWQPV